jgi:hypothetical protein
LDSSCHQIGSANYVSSFGQGHRCLQGTRPNKANTRPSTSPLPTGGRNCSSPANAWPKALARPCRPYCTRPSTPSPHARGVKDTSRDGKYHNKREFVALAGELGLAWPEGQRPHLVIGFSDVQLTEQALPTTPTPLACLGAAIRLYRNTFRRLGLLGGQGEDGRQAGQDGDRQQPTGKAGERFKVACGCQPPRSFWIRAQQYTPGADLRRSLRPGLPTSGRRQQQSR